MTRLQRAAVLVSLIEALRREGSWCGETNIQKGAYFLQELLGVPLGFEFTLYKYGPYSFDLSEELTSLCADSILRMELRDERYGPSYVASDLRSVVLDRFPHTVKRYRRQIDFVAGRLGAKRVPELERLATALYVRLMTTQVPGTKKRATRIRELKPHISKADSEEAVVEVDEMFDEAAALRA